MKIIRLSNYRNTITYKRKFDDLDTFLNFTFTYLTNFKESFLIFTRLFKVLVGSLLVGGGYGNCNKNFITKFLLHNMQVLGLFVKTYPVFKYRFIMYKIPLFQRFLQNVFIFKIWQ